MTQIGRLICIFIKCRLLFIYLIIFFIHFLCFFFFYVMQVGHNPSPEHVGAWENKRGLKISPPCHSSPNQATSFDRKEPTAPGPRLAPSLNQAALKASGQQVPADWRSMLPMLSLCSIIWLNRGIKLRKVHKSTSSGQVWNRCLRRQSSSTTPPYRLLKMLLRSGWHPLLPSFPDPLSHRTNIRVQWLNRLLGFWGGFLSRRTLLLPWDSGCTI